MADELSALGGRRRRPPVLKGGGQQGKRDNKQTKGHDQKKKVQTVRGDDEKSKRQLPLREPQHDEQALFDSLVGKHERKHDLGHYSSLLRSSSSPSTSAPSARYNTRPRSSRISDEDLISTMAARLRSVERQLHLANQACSEKDKTIGSLRRKIKQLEAEKAFSEGLAADARAVTHEMSRLQRQVHQMETFLADYGLVWVGGSDEDDDEEEEEEVDAAVAAKDDDGLAAEAQRRAQTTASAPTAKVTDQQPPRKQRQQRADDDDESAAAKPFKVDFDKVLRNVEELNLLAGEGAAKIVRGSDDNTARLQHTESVPLTLYRNGFLLFQGPFRAYEDGTAQMFMRDLMDGYFPWELKERFPEGCPFAVKDKRNEDFKRPVIKSFPGVGMVLGGNHEQSRLIDKPSAPLVEEEARPNAVQVAPGQQQAQGSTGRFLSRLPPAVVVNGVVVDIRGAVASHVGHETPGKQTKQPAEGQGQDKQQQQQQQQQQRGGVEFVATPVASLLRQHAEAISSGGPAPDIRPHTPLDITTLQIRVVGSHRRLMLKMRYRDTVGDVRKQIAQHDNDLTSFRLIRGFPKLVLKDASATLEELQLVPTATLHLSPAKSS